MPQLKVVIFDCDGVMFNSRRANEAYYNQILKHFNREMMNEDECNFVHMHTADESVAYLFREAPGLRSAAQEYRKQIDYIPFIPYMAMASDLIPLLKYLRPAYHTAISTNRTDTMQHVLSMHGLEGYFDFVVSALDVERPKPYPESLQKILRHFKIRPEEAFYIGDSEVDQAASEAAGVPLVAYKNRKLSALYYIDSFRELEKIIGKFRS
jgi:HAD superfamily hydrolase (TIGR01549 family)